MPPPDELVFAPLGGVGEIGMNLSIYGLAQGKRRNWLIVDCGVSFGDEERSAGHRSHHARTSGFLEAEKKKSCRHRSDPRA